MISEEKRDELKKRMRNILNRADSEKGRYVPCSCAKKKSDAKSS